MKLRKTLRKSLTAFAFCITAVVVLTLPVLGSEQTEATAETIVINAGAIGAVVGVFGRVYIKWKEKEIQLKREGKLPQNEYLEFNWRYGRIAILTMAIELVPTVLLPAMALGSVFTSGDPIIDFFNGLFRGAIAASLITVAMKHVRPMNLPEEG